MVPGAANQHRIAVSELSGRRRAGGGAPLGHRGPIAEGPICHEYVAGSRDAALRAIHRESGSVLGGDRNQYRRPGHPRLCVVTGVRGCSPPVASFDFRQAAGRGSCSYGTCGRSGSFPRPGGQGRFVCRWRSSGEPNDRGIPMKSRVEVPLFRRLAYLADATITKSEEMAQVLPAGLRPRNHAIPNGVDLRQFQPRDRLLARRGLGWATRGARGPISGETLATLERISPLRATPSLCLPSRGQGSPSRRLGSAPREHPEPDGRRECARAAVTV